MRARGMLSDIVIVNEQASSYVQDLQQAIETLCENAKLRGKELGPRQHIFAVRRDLMDADSYQTLLVGGAGGAAHPQRQHPRPDRARRVGRAAGARAGRLRAWRGVRRRIAGQNAGAKARGGRRPGARWRRTGLLERLWRFRPRRARLCRAADRRALDAASVDQRHRQPEFRLPHLGRGRLLHLEPQQSRLPADDMVQRPGDQPAGRGDLRVRPGERRAPSRPSRRWRATRRPSTRRGTARDSRNSPSSAGRCRSS